MDRIVGQWVFENSRKDSGDEWEINLDGQVMRAGWTAENDKATKSSESTAPRLGHDRAGQPPRRDERNHHGQHPPDIPRRPRDTGRRRDPGLQAAVFAKPPRPPWNDLTTSSSSRSRPDQEAVPTHSQSRTTSPSGSCESKARRPSRKPRNGSPPTEPESSASRLRRATYVT
jgi:hypothetical protein